jgi:hypothetical protein
MVSSSRAPAGAAARAAVLCLCLAPLAGCAATGSRDLGLGLGLSLLPNIGLAAQGSQVMRETPDWTWSGELELTHQFIDEESLSDDGNPPAGDWTQVQLGLLWASHPEGRRHWTHRAGMFWFRALGEPNIIDDPGDYVGLYYGAGYRTDFGPHLSMGPELALLGAFREGGGVVEVVPQFTWRVIWRP